MTPARLADLFLVLGAIGGSFAGERTLEKLGIPVVCVDLAAGRWAAICVWSDARGSAGCPVEARVWLSVLASACIRLLEQLLFSSSEEMQREVRHSDEERLGT
jgi:hypothetical protein